MELGGVTEVAIALGMSKQRVSALRARLSFPHPEAQLAQGPVWDMHKIRRWAETSRQPRGRPHTLSVRQRYGNRYELEGLPESDGLRKATDLVALGSGRRSCVVALHLIPSPSSTDDIEVIGTKLDRLAETPHPHVLPVLDHGVEGEVQPYFVTPLPYRRLSRVLVDPGGEDFAAMEVLKQVTQGVLHLIRAKSGTGLVIDSSTVVQGASSAWMVAGIRPDLDSPTTDALISGYRALLADVRRSQTCLGDEVLAKSLQWLDSRLAKRSLSIHPEKFVLLILDDLGQVAELLSHRVPRTTNRPPQHWIVDAVRQGIDAPDLLCSAVGSLARTGKADPRADSGMIPREVAARLLPVLSQTQLDALQRQHSDLLQHAVSVWCADLASFVESAEAVHTATNFLMRVLELEDDSLLTPCLLGLVSLAARQSEWQARAALISLLQNVRERGRTAVVAEGLAICDPEELQKALKGIEPRWFPSRICEILTRVTTSDVIDLTEGGRIGLSPRIHGRRAAGV